MTTMTANGRVPRKSLSDQLDRLDRILDVLGEGLQEAVADAVQEAVRQAVAAAVQAAVTEVLTNPELGRRLRPAPPPDVPVLEKARALAGRVAAAATAAWVRTAAATGRCWVALRARLGGARARVAGATRCLRSRVLLTAALARQFRGVLAVAACVGTVVGVGCFWAGPLVAATVSGLGGFAGALTVGAVSTLRRALTRPA
jgi:hypothetical protein